MNDGSRAFPRFCCALPSVGCSPLLLSQQSNLQTSFFSPAAFHCLTGVVADVAETEHLPYIKQVARKTAKRFTLPAQCRPIY